ncbi:MAG: hypothetical protein OXE40_03295 [Gammaproteobacteria bacterium]|nr:hypothetical protein [Gammaproteobacteria bacterium]
MQAKKISVPVTADMEKTLDELSELHALQRPALCTMLLRDALAGRRSPLLPKRASTSQDGSEAVRERAPSGELWGAERGTNGDS